MNGCLLFVTGTFLAKLDAKSQFCTSFLRQIFDLFHSSGRFGAHPLVYSLLSGVIFALYVDASAQALYPLLDSGIEADSSAGTPGPVWIDNDRVVFFGEDPRKRIPGKPLAGPSSGPRSPNSQEDQFVWNTTQNSLRRTPRLMSNLCAHKGMVSFVTEEPPKSRNRFWYYGPWGKEKKHTYLDIHWYWRNPHSCKYYDIEPAWKRWARERQRATAPLLESHGFIDLGAITTTDRSRWILVVPGDPPSQVPIKSLWGALQPEVPRTYVTHEDAYTFSSSRKPVDGYLLKGNGDLFKAAFPQDSPPSNGAMLYTKKGFFYYSLATKNDRDTSTIGGYLLEGEKLTRVVVGTLFAPGVSPDGCKLAFGHAVSDKAHYDGIAARQRGGLGNTTVKMINVCERSGG